VQRPGQSDGSSGGDPEFISALVLAAVAAGCDGLFLEAHPNPEQAPSDGHNMLALKDLGPLMERALAVRGAVESAGGPASNPATA
jgi:2-dehydro-3-deoxyphosphooctonate aldolase (KDO 8-P synthase)